MSATPVVPPLCTETRPDGRRLERRRGPVREVVNVLGGNVKALVSGGRSLGLPVLASGRPTLDGDLVGEVHVGWLGHVAHLGIWHTGSPSLHSSTTPPRK